MLKKEQNYDFRKRMCNMHKRFAVRKDDSPLTNELSLPEKLEISLSEKSEVALVAVNDFISYLKTVFGISAKLTDNDDAFIKISVAPSMLKEANTYMGRRIAINEDVRIYAYDSRGIAQALYSLEDAMNDRRAPYLKKEDKEHKPLFSPRMIHSGYDVDEYPDEYLSACAHHGYDAIILFVKDATHTVLGECDINDVIKRAARYGIDVYAYCYFMHFVHPDDENAKESYASAYGDIFRVNPGLKGMIFVGESVEFPSRDPHVVPFNHRTPPKDGIPFEKRFPGWWPCYDYKDWISLVRDSIREVKPDADIVLWTYNWGYVEEKYRIALIESLPTDISLLVTYEMFDKYKCGDSIASIRDYTISKTGPSVMFTSEAAAAKKKGIRLYSQVNTAGRTWDYGVAPYEPFIHAWNKRNQSLLESQEKYGLSGLMESHHFGFYPSFITRLAKDTFTTNTLPFDERVDTLCRTFSQSECTKVREALDVIDKAIYCLDPTEDNQYGPMRIGPAFPFNLRSNIRRPDKPGLMFGSRICYTLNQICDYGLHSPFSVRVRYEMANHKKSAEYLKNGIKILRSIKNKSTDLERLINLCEFLMRCHITAANQKEFHIYRQRLLASDTIEKVNACAKKLNSILLRERANVEKTIPLVEKDSALGYEPSMGYQCDKEALLWKLKHTDFVIANDISTYLKKY